MTSRAAPSFPGWNRPSCCRRLQLHDNSGLCVAMVSPPHPSPGRPACRVPPAALLLAGSPFATELLCFLFLAYPCACAYYSLYRCASWEVCKPAVFLARFCSTCRQARCAPHLPPPCIILQAGPVCILSHGAAPHRLLLAVLLR